MSDLVKNHKDRLSHNAAQIVAGSGMQDSIFYTKITFYFSQFLPCYITLAGLSNNMTMSVTALQCFIQTMITLKDKIPFKLEKVP